MHQALFESKQAMVGYNSHYDYGKWNLPLLAPTYCYNFTVL